MQRKIRPIRPIGPISRIVRAGMLLTLAALLGACTLLPPARPPLTILVSLDGFRADYLHRDGARNLRAMATRGMRAESMQPSFPTTTFPNHYTLVTGLTPDHHGVVGHAMEDKAIPGERFSAANQKAMRDPRWWDQAEPVWVTAEKRHIRTGILMWPGSEAAIHGVLAQDYLKFDGTMTAATRVNTVLAWLDRPEAERPRFVAMYFPDVDLAGHAFGPDTAQVKESIDRVDAALGRLQDGLRSRGIVANIVVVSDHGMAATSAQRVIKLSELAPAGSYRLIATVPYAGIEAMPGKEDFLSAALLQAHAHLQCWPKEKIPARLQFGANDRVPAFICLADPGWMVAADAELTRLPAGTHGYDNAATDMQALFIASGPAFRPGVVVAPFSNVNVYALLMKLVGLPALPSDGSLAPLAGGLQQ